MKMMHLLRYIYLYIVRLIISLFRDMMKLGSSVHWEEALEAITGSRQMSAEPLVEYFQPLLDWLDEQIEDLGLTVGWDEASCPGDILTGETDSSKSQAYRFN